MPSRRRAALFISVFVVFSLVIVFAIGEIVVRALGHTDADGTFYFRDRAIPPLALPVHNARMLVDEYLRDPNGYLMYDADLGWTHRPHACAHSNLFCANSDGLRADRDFTKAIPADTLRVSLFGDSFIHGHDVVLDGSIAPQLERALATRGTRAEALNFGVGGFGMDQAYMRYSRDGGRFDTDVVVAGLQLENIERHVMLFRIIKYPRSKIPFSKPRYYFEGPSLLVANRPTVPPEKIADTLANFHHSPLRRYESFYDDRYARRWYRHSRLIAIFEKIDSAYVDDGEGMRVTRAILERFRDDVAVTKKPFLLVYLPLKANLAAQLAGAADPWEPLVAPLRKEFTIVDPTPGLLALAREKGVDAVAPLHYTAEGNRIVAEALADAIVKLKHVDR